MPDLVKFSDLKDSQPLTLNGDDLVAVAHKEQSSTTGYSTMTTTPTQLSQYAIEEQTFVNLKTSSKTVETSINQTISNLADDYDNTATYDIDDCVLYEGNLYKCITAIPVEEEWDSTHWEQVKAVDVGSGGGGGASDYEDLSNKPQVNSVELVGNKSLDDLGIMPASLSKTVSGSIAHFTDGADNIPVKSLVAEIVASQAGSGTPSPSNPRAISGYTDVVVKNDVQGATQATYTIALGSTVYGGTLDVTKGILTVTHGIVDLGGFTWVSEDDLVSGQARVSSTEVLPLGVKYNQIPLCSQFVGVQPKGYSGFNDGEIGFSNNETLPMIRAKSTNFVGKTDAEIKSLMSGVQFVFELATPVVINLTPTEVLTLLGENNIYADTGDVEIEYFTEDAKPIADLVETYIDATKSGSVHSYTAHLTSSQYGWFTFVDENGNDLLASVGIPLQATAITDSKYYHGLFSQQTSGLWLFKVADINDSGNYKPIGTSLSNIQFNLSYIAL